MVLNSKAEYKLIYNNIQQESIRYNYESTVDKSLGWKLWHSINYMIGGITFFFGSYCYFSYINATYSNSFVVGGWLYTIGSLCFLIADLTEWNHFKFGCFTETEYTGEKSLFNTLLRAEIGINFFCSAIGSLMYLLGSIFFIPSLDMLPAGECLFIYGSLVIFFSQLWKCLRTCFMGGFKLINVTDDFSGLLVDLCAGLGGLCYYFGTVLFKNMITEYDQNIASHWFVTGGTFFTLSGLAMQYRYYLNPTVEIKRDEENETII
jgi:hypothetical protein